MSSKVLQVFLGTDLRCTHLGLAEIAKRNKVDVEKLIPGEYVLFLNNDKNKLKLYAANHIVAYLRLPGNQKLDMKTIALIPRAFHGSGRIDYNKALKEVLEEALRKKGRVVS
jgi:hypothetical protein